ncbi:MAG: MFS transporter [Sciscionella sp.]
MGVGELAARLDRLPISRFHRRVMLALAFAFFFELADLDTFAFAAPGIRKYLGIDVNQIALITAAGFLGMFLGASIGGWLADRVGRRRAIVWSVIWYSIFSLLNAATYDVPTMLAARLLTGVGLSALTVIAITYLSETMPYHRRGRIQAATLGFGLIGIPAVAFLARGVVPLGSWGWRVVFLFGALGVFGLVVMSRLPESPRWLLNHGRVEDAERTLVAIEEETRGVEGELPPVPAVPEHYGKERQVGLGDLFGPRLAGRTVLLWIVWIFQTLGFYGFVSFVPTLLAAHGFSLVHSLTFSAITTVGAVPGAFFAWLLSDRFGRKHSLWAVSLIIAACGLLYGAGFTNATIALFGFLVGFFIQTFAALLYAYTPELYPTSIRNGGSGFAYGVGRLANIAGPFIVAALFGTYGYIWVFVYIAACWLIVALVVGLWGASTARRELEDLNTADASTGQPHRTAPH